MCVLQVAEVLMLSSLLSLVCEEDGTEVDSEEFLTALPDNTVFMGLDSGQTWLPFDSLTRMEHCSAYCTTLRRDAQAWGPP